MADTLINKDKLIGYLEYLHINKFDKPISRIKLQKALYFLYAYWIKTLTIANSTENEIKDLVSGLSDHLFDAKFEAWAYGPVDREVYGNHKNNNISPLTDKEVTIFNNDISEKSTYLQEYLDSMIQRIFNTSDFGLVDLSHKDSSWKNNYKGPNHNPFDKSDMSHEDIAKDYEKK